MKGVYILKHSYENLMDYLNQHQQLTRTNHLETIIKPIPDSDRTGDLDPRVLETLSENMASVLPFERGRVGTDAGDIVCEQYPECDVHV